MPVVTALAEFTLRLFVIWIVCILKIRAHFAKEHEMKDAKGHGSNKRTSNADAANALASALKSTQAPVHDAMVGQQGVAIGDRVHLGFGAKGGAGYFGRLVRNDGTTAEIKHDNGKTYTGPSRHLSK